VLVAHRLGTSSLARVQVVKEILLESLRLGMPNRLVAVPSVVVAIRRAMRIHLAGGVCMLALQCTVRETGWNRKTSNTVSMV
jgi:hypothetical protein